MVRSIKLAILFSVYKKRPRRIRDANSRQNIYYYILHLSLKTGYTLNIM